MTTTAAVAPFFALLIPASAPPPIHTSYQDYRLVSGFAGLVEAASMPRSFLSLQLPIPATEIVKDVAESSVVATLESRVTTPAEHAIGEFRRWKELNSDWDGEGASAPNRTSLHEASAFACLLADDRPVEPMLHASGRAGLYFRTATLYADLEFLGDGRTAYYVERNGGKHKGVVNFDSQEQKMPAVFETLLQV